MYATIGVFNVIHLAKCKLSNAAENHKKNKMIVKKFADRSLGYMSKSCIRYCATAQQNSTPFTKGRAVDLPSGKRGWIHSLTGFEDGSGGILDNRLKGKKFISSK